MAELHRDDRQPVTIEAEGTQEVARVESTLPVVAHQGAIELLDAKWELNSGRTVKFRIVDTPTSPMVLHPFAQFVRRRGNHIGTRFHVAVVRYGEEKPYFNGEMMLAGGGNPLGQGMWVRFWLDDEADDHPFAGCTGRRGDQPGDLFGAVFVELDDDDAAINQKKRGRVEGAQRHKGGGLARYAGMLCHHDVFLMYLHEKVPIGDPPAQRPVEWWGSDDHAARWIRWVCGVESRAQLDQDQKAAEVFHERIRRPYSEWRGTAED